MDDVMNKIKLRWGRVISPCSKEKVKQLKVSLFENKEKEKWEKRERREFFSTSESL